MINKNHEFEDLDGMKCAVVERGVSEQRMTFLRWLLEGNGYQVITVAVAPKVAPPPAEGPAPVPPPPTYTVGVSDVMFNATNAIFGRLLRTPEGKVVTLAYWRQEESMSNDEKPYFQ